MSALCQHGERFAVATLEERDEARVELLLAYYEATDGGASHQWVDDYREFGAARGFDETLVESETKWLRERDLISHPVMGPVIEMTRFGVDKAEEILRERRELDGAAAEASTALSGEEERQVEVVVLGLRKLVEDEGTPLSKADRADLLAQVETIESQMKSPRPRKAVVRWALSAAVWVVDNAGAGLVGAGAVVAAQELLGVLG